MSTPNTQLLYSVFSGCFYHIPANDLPLVAMGHLPLKKQPHIKCNMCHGRGYVSRSTKDFTYPPCICVQKAINFDILKELEKHYPQLSRSLS